MLQSRLSISCRHPHIHGSARRSGEMRSGNLVSTARNRFRPAVSCLTAVALLLAQAPIARAASAMTRDEYEACQASDEAGFRAAIEALTRKGLETGLANVDYRALVADEWRRGNIDDLIDREVAAPSARYATSRAGSSCGRRWP